MRRSIGLAAIDGVSVCARKRTQVAATSRASATKGLGWLAVRLHINMGGERIVLLAESGRWPVAGRLSLSVSRRFLTTELYFFFILFCHVRTCHLMYNVYLTSHVSRRVARHLARPAE